MPMRKTPPSASTMRPRRGGGEGTLGQRDQHAGDAVEQHGPGRPEEPGRPGGEDAAEGLAEDPHDESPAGAGQARPAATTGPRGATISQRPSPTWIQTAADAAWIGWLDQMLTPLFTRCCTQPGEPAAAGCITLDGSPSGMEDWSWSSPSRIQRQPKPMRRMLPGGRFGRREALASRETSSRPWSLSRRYWMRPDDVEADGAQRADQENDEQLVEERRMERRDDDGVARLQRAAHAGHGLVGLLRTVARPSSCALRADTTAGRGHVCPRPRPGWRTSGLLGATALLRRSVARSPRQG